MARVTACLARLAPHVEHDQVAITGSVALGGRRPGDLGAEDGWLRSAALELPTSDVCFLLYRFVLPARRAFALLDAVLLPV